MTVATSDDVAKRVGRPLTTLERGRVEALLEDAEVEITRVAADRLTDPAWEKAVIKVECSMVIRAARLPDALGNVIPEPESTGFQSVPATQGDVYIRRSERRSLGLSNSAAVMGSPVPDCPVVHISCWDPWCDCGWGGDW